MPFLSPNQQCQSTEGKLMITNYTDTKREMAELLKRYTYITDGGISATEFCLVAFTCVLQLEINQHFLLLELGQLLLKSAV